MKKTFALIFFLSVAGLTAKAQTQKSQLSLDDIFHENIFKSKTVTDIRWLPDGSAFTFTREVKGKLNVYRHDVKTGRETLILESATLTHKGRAVAMSAYTTTGNQDHLLITGPQKQIWRHSYSAPYFIYSIKTKNLTALAGGEAGLQNVDLSPDEKSVAFVKDNNLYVADVATGSSRQLTFDGSDDILNGVFDWVYEEEFGRADALRWSPDGKHIAFWRSDQKRVKEFTMLDELPTYSVATKLKYPKVGEEGSIVKIGVVSLATEKIVWMNTGSDDNVYLPRMDWTNASTNLSIQLLNRRQNNLQLLLADIVSGKCQSILTDTDKAWVDVTDDFIFLKRKNQFVWTSERTGFRHIYLSDYQGKLVAQLTKGDWEVSEVLAVDEKEGLVYFYGKKDSPVEQHVYRVKFDGSSFQKVSGAPGWRTAEFSPDCRHFVEFWSDAATPPKVILKRADGQKVRVLEDNKIEVLNEYILSKIEYLSFKTSDGTKLNTYLIKPPDFDPSKKYPVIMFGYGGPGSQIVINSWGMGSRNYHHQRMLWHQYMAQQGFIIFCVDNRGTGGRGKAFKNLAYRDLSKWVVHDQIEGAKYMASLPYVDKQKIGCWGWSGGGYLTSMLMTRAGDFFAAGIAVAPVTDFRNYDNIWTERYMDLPTLNSEGYDLANVLEYADGLKGKLLLVHGTGDDNVHPQNTMQFVQELIEVNKQFQIMLYPNRNHRIRGGNTYRHLYTMMTEFFISNLK